MLHSNDFRTIWELAHLWAGSAPDKTDPQNLPDAVVDKLQKLIWAFMRNKIGLRYKNGIKAIRSQTTISDKTRFFSCLTGFWKVSYGRPI